MRLTMDKGLIIREYEQSRDKNAQIAILADLNGCSVDEIMNVLIDAGKISGMPKAKRAKAESTKWTPELDAEVSRLAKEGLTVVEIAERLGMNKQCIYDRRMALKNQAKRLSMGFENKLKAENSLTCKPTETGIEKKTAEVPPPAKEVCGVLRDIIEMLREVGLEVTECNINVLERSFVISGVEKQEG